MWNLHGNWLIVKLVLSASYCVRIIDANSCFVQIAVVLSLFEQMLSTLNLSKENV